MRLTWTVFPLHPETPDEGLELAELFAGRDFDLEAMQRRLAAVASEEGLPLQPRSRTYNSRHAQEVGKLADALGLMEPFQQGVYRAYFVEGRNIAQPEELIAIAARAGLPEDEARRVLEEGAYAKAVGDDWRRARLLGISGVPAFLSAGKLLVGFRPYRDFEALIGRV